MRSFRSLTAVVVTVALLVLPTIAGAHPDPGSSNTGDGSTDTYPFGQHGDHDGHLPAENVNTELVSKLELTQEAGRVSDVSYLNGYAYLGAYDEPDCQSGGVYVVDMRNVEQPKFVSYIPSHTDTLTSEGVQAIEISTPKFNGDLLLHSNERCPDKSGSSKNGIGGMTIIDVSNPHKPKKLVEGWGDFTTRGKAQRQTHTIHSVMAWDAGDKAYAVMIDNDEALDVDIADITDPAKPKMISETGLPEWPAANIDGFGSSNFFHDVDVEKFGDQWIMLASYWDAGYVKLNVTNPATPVFLGDTDVSSPDPEFPHIEQPEGNAHQSDWNGSGEYLLATDEDFSPYRTLPFTITSGSHAGSEYDSVSVGGGGSVTDLPDKKLNGPVVYGGYGCPNSAPVPPPPADYVASLDPGEEKIVVLQRGPTGDPSAPEEACFPGEKAEMGINAGYDAVVFVQRHLGSAAADDNPPFCGSGAFPDGDPIPQVCTTHEAFHHLFESTPNYALPYQPGTEPAIGSVGQEISVEAIFDGWGYVHLWDADTLEELDTYAVDETKLEENASGKGDLSVHEVERDQNSDDLMHYAYYSAGYRATRIVEDDAGAHLEEVASFIDEGGNNFWGLTTIQDPRTGHAGETLVLLSDRDFGLYVVRYTG